jgi:glycosyltransferase involved in cell wall biosynthesis
MKFSIVSPSLNQTTLLTKAVASVADQSEISTEHIIQDGLTPSADWIWAGKYSHLQVVTEKDKGMYDALNQGFQRTTGQILAWLNCDEQYLPGTLNKVIQIMNESPEIDILYGDSLVVNENGNLLAFRKTIQLSPSHFSILPLDLLSCSLFFRRSAWEKSGGFDAHYKSVGDLHWLSTCVKKGLTLKHVPQYFGVYTFSGRNLSHNKTSIEETKSWQKNFGVNGLRAIGIKAGRYLSKWNSGCYSSDEITYQIYTNSSMDKRVEFSCKNPTWKWPKL